MKASDLTTRNIIGSRYPDRQFDPAAESAERRAAEGGRKRRAAEGQRAHTLERARREVEGLERDDG